MGQYVGNIKKGVAPFRTFVDQKTRCKNNVEPIYFQNSRLKHKSACDVQNMAILPLSYLL